METITMKLNSPITDEQWNIITDAELERSDEIEFTTPSGKKAVYAKVRHGKWIEINTESGIFMAYDEVKCSECGFVEFFNKGWAKFKYCPTCGAKMDSNDSNDSNALNALNALEMNEVNDEVN